MDYKLTLHRETLGVTQRALKALRDELAARIDHEVLIFQVPSRDGPHVRCYGIFLVDRTTEEIVIIGDGFRGDNSGEGGKGHRAAQSLLSIYGLTPVELGGTPYTVDYVDDVSAYQERVNDALRLAGEYHFEIAWGKLPGYVDWCFR